MPDYDFYHGLYSGQQVDSAVARALAGGQLDQDIAAIRAAVGSPLVANTAAEMTNVNKIYVYTGSEAGYSTGHWYYYEGGEWNDGGLYNSAAADDAMSDSSTNAVQNKVIKEYVDTAIYAEQTRAEGVESLKAPLASPALTGTPTAPTAAAGTANTQIATTAYADNAVAVEKARAEAVEATKADKSYADYILLREEEDRQILFGSIVEAAEDEYSELRSAPIHNAITIGGSVYPRMDRTRMAIDAIKGRTVAFNQLFNNSNTTNTSGGITFTLANGKLSFSGTATTTYAFIRTLGKFVQGHKYAVIANVLKNTGNNTFSFSTTGGSSTNPLVGTRVTGTGLFGNIVSSALTVDSAGFGLVNIVVDTSYDVEAYISIFDLTQQYGTTLADQIYAMEQATTGAGVAYVRQRMDLDYYASNAGELKAPVVSGVTVGGFNLWDEVWELGSLDPNTGLPKNDSNTIRAKNFIEVTPSTQYFIIVPTGLSVRWFAYQADGTFIKRSGSMQESQVFTTQANCGKIKIIAGETTYNNDICINISNASLNGQYRPYVAPTSLPLPSTRLDGVGTAQDWLEVVEDGENDYSLHLHKVMGEVDLGTLNWTRSEASGTYFFYATVPTVASAETDVICPLYELANVAVFNMPNKSFRTEANRIDIRDDSYTTEAAFTTAMSGVMLCYEKTTPTETVIAEHLTLAEVSAIAENGGIISIVSDTGHIVQPDVVMDTVISRSAS